MSNWPTFALVLLLVIPTAWLVLTVYLFLWALKEKQGYFLSVILFFAPLAITPFIGMVAGAKSGSGNWGPSGAVAAPILFYGGPMWAIVGLQEKSRGDGQKSILRRIEANPDIIWSEKIYQSSYSSAKWSALMEYWNNNPPDLSAEQLHILIDAGHTFYLKNPKLDEKYLADYYSDWISKKSKFSLSEDLLINPNCPNEILLTVAKDRDFGYSAMGLAAAELKKREAHHAVQPTP